MDTVTLSSDLKTRSIELKAMLKQVEIAKFKQFVHNFFINEESNLRYKDEENKAIPTHIKISTSSEYDDEGGTYLRLSEIYLSDENEKTIDDGDFWIIDCDGEEWDVYEALKEEINDEFWGSNFRILEDQGRIKIEDIETQEIELIGFPTDHTRMTAIETFYSQEKTNYVDEVALETLREHLLSEETLAALKANGIEGIPYRVTLGFEMESDDEGGSDPWLYYLNVYDKDEEEIDLEEITATKTRSYGTFKMSLDELLKDQLQSTDIYQYGQEEYIIEQQ